MAMTTIAMPEEGHDLREAHWPWIGDVRIFKGPE